MKLSSFETKNLIIQPKNVIAFDFELFIDAENAVPYARAFCLVSKMIMKLNRGLTFDGIERKFRHAEFFAEAHSFVTLMFEFILAKWKKDEKRFFKRRFSFFEVFGRKLVTTFSSSFVWYSIF